MSGAVIHGEGLGKRYRRGLQVDDGLRHSLEALLRSPIAALRRKREETFWALKDVSLEVKEGEVLGLIGRNGAGKTTLLKILSRITRPTTGWAEIHGRVGSLLEVGTGFHPELTGRENIFLNGAILGMSRVEIKGKFDEIVAFSEVEKFLDTPVKRYSSGMYVRLAFAVAAHLEPEILIVDEVLAVGDVQFQKKCLGKMQQVSTTGRTVLFVSHNMAAIESLCTVGVYLKQGKVCGFGGIADVMAAYLATARNPNGDLLKHRLDRDGAGAVRMTRIWIETKGKAVDHVASGNDVAIAIEYEATEADRLNNVRVSVAVRTAHEQTLFLCSSEIISPQKRNCPPRGIVRCLVPHLPLSGGRYILFAYFEVDGVAQDSVTNAAVLDVEDGDFYGSGKLYPPGWQGQGVLVPQHWTWPDMTSI